jgi:hypothetical protein
VQTGTPRDRLTALRGLIAGGRLQEAAAALADLAADPGAAALGPLTAAGMPRPLHSAALKLAKRQADRGATAWLRLTLVPPDGVLGALLAASPPDRPARAAADRGALPKILHQVWIGDRPVPVTTVAWAAWAARQGWRHRLWREPDLERLGTGEDATFRAMRDRGDLPGAVDVARYLILAEEGGLYLDCDFYPARPDLPAADWLPQAGLVAMDEPIPRATGRGTLLLANSLIGAPPGHPAFRRILDCLPGVAAALPGGPAWWVTGPLIFTLVAREGPVALTAAGTVAADLPPATPLAEVEARVTANIAAGGGPLFAWKPWG